MTDRVWHSLMFDDFDPDIELDEEELDGFSIQTEDLVVDNLGEDVVD